MISEASTKNSFNVRKVLLDKDCETEVVGQCPVCAANGIENHLRYFYVSLTEALFKCNGIKCMYPFENFIYKNYENDTTYRYEKVILESLAEEMVPEDQLSMNAVDDKQDNVDGNFDEISTDNTVEYCVDDAQINTRKLSKSLKQIKCFHGKILKFQKIATNKSTKYTSKLQDKKIKNNLLLKAATKGHKSFLNFKNCNRSKFLRNKSRTIGLTNLVKNGQKLKPLDFLDSINKMDFSSV